jgi:hypothetical protein
MNQALYAHMNNKRKMKKKMKIKQKLLYGENINHSLPGCCKKKKKSNNIKCLADNGHSVNVINDKT